MVYNTLFTGGPLAVTDANLVLGRLLPDYFPKIFGKSEDQPLDMEASLNGFKELTKQVSRYQGLAIEPSCEGVDIPVWSCDQGISQRHVHPSFGRVDLMDFADVIL